MTEHKLRSYDQKLVLFGGGTGLSNLTRGLIQFNNPEKITAVPGVWDDGGSSGKLRDEFGSLPPGDSRQVALAGIEDKKAQIVAQKLFDDRLADIEGPFKGHSVGNLIMARLEKLYYGQDRGIDAFCDLFGVRIKIKPVSLADLRLTAKTESGIEINGETNIDYRKKREDFNPKDRINRIYFNTYAPTNPEVIKAVEGADKIIFSSGDLYTSVLPHLLTDGLTEALARSKAKIALVLNLMTKAGETDYYKASDHLEKFVEYLEDKRTVDYMIANKNGINPSIMEIYKKEGQEPVEVDFERCQEISPNTKVVYKPVAKYYQKSHLLRHDLEKLPKAILEL